MNSEKILIGYRTFESQSFPNMILAQKYLMDEAATWRSFLESLKSFSPNRGISFVHRQVSFEEIGSTFDRLTDNAVDRKTLERLADTTSHSRPFIPPPSSSVFGQLILQLNAKNHNTEAISAYIFFLKNEYNVDIVSREFQQYLDDGRVLYLTAHAAEALPFKKASAAQIAGTARSIANRIKFIDDEIDRAKSINSNHELALQKQREAQEETARSWWQRAKRAQSWIIAREKSRAQRYNGWKSRIQNEIDNEFSKARLRLKALERLNKSCQEKRQEEFDRLLELFQTHLRLRAPTTLWEKREKEHNSAARIAIIRFYILALCVLLVATLVPYHLGDYIANSFSSTSCSTEEPSNCTQVFSAKGPLTLGGLLLAMSLLMWWVRIQYKVYLSERHLALDASEKKAFAETYLAIKEGAKFDPASEAIVLASLFRPTQDGVIKDDESGLDISAASIIARHLSRPGS